jgi:hypothetical protein
LQVIQYSEFVRGSNNKSNVENSSHSRDDGTFDLPPKSRSRRGRCRPAWQTASHSGGLAIGADIW